MAINLTDALNAATTKGKLADAKQIYLEGDNKNLQDAHKDNEDHLSTLDTRSTQIEEALKTIAATGGASNANAVIYDNNVSGLTAINVKGALDELAMRITFAGIATPTTNPGTPDGPVFYLAAEPGVYSNFSNITVDIDEAAILVWKDGDTWEKEVSGFASSSYLMNKVSRLNETDNKIKEELSEKVSVNDIFTLKPILNNSERVNTYIKSDGSVSTSYKSDKLLSYVDIQEGDILEFTTAKGYEDSLAYAFYNSYPINDTSLPSLSASTFIEGDNDGIGAGIEHQYIVTVPKGALSFVVSQSRTSAVSVIRRINNSEETAKKVEKENSVDTNEVIITTIADPFNKTRVYFRELAPNATTVIFNLTKENSYSLYDKEGLATTYNCKRGLNKITIDENVDSIEYGTTANEEAVTYFYNDTVTLKDYSTHNISDLSQSLESNSKAIDNYIFGIEKKDIELKWLCGGIDKSGGYYYRSSPRTKHTEIELKYYDSVFVTFNSTLINMINGSITSCFIKEADGSRTEVAVSKGQEKMITSELHPNGVLIINVAYGDEIVVQGSKKPISSNSDGGFMNIIQISGDSLVNGLPTVMSNLVALANGYSCQGTAGGGEISLVNLVNMGGIAFIPQNEVTIPTTGESPIFKIFANWRDSKGNYRAIKFNNTKDGGGCRINGEHFDIQSVNCPYSALALYTEDGAFIEDFTDNGKTIKLSSYPTAKKLKITINNPMSNVAHLSIDKQDYTISDIVTQNGGIAINTGVFTSDVNYKCSNFIDIPEGSTSIYYDSLASDDVIKLVRTSEGETFKINESTKIYAEKKWTNAKCLQILFTGQNGGYESEDDYVEQLWSATRQFQYNQFLIATSYGFPNGSIEAGTIVTTPTLAQKMTARFGERYLNLREYFEKQSVNDALRLGYISDSHTSDEWKTLFIADGIHPNDIGKKLIVLAMWNKMLDLNMISGKYL